MRCTGDGGDKCRKVKCTGGAWEVVGISTERSTAQEVCRRCRLGVREVVGINAERSNVWEVCGKWWG